MWFLAHNKGFGEKKRLWLRPEHIIFIQPIDAVPDVINDEGGVEIGAPEHTMIVLSNTSVIAIADNADNVVERLTVYDPN